MHLEGIHHVSAITAASAECTEFYGELLGLDRVPRTRSGTRLDFGDARGTPGSVISFDEIPGARPGRPGAGLVHCVLWRVEGPGALEFWQRRLELAGVEVEEAGDAGLRFADPEGLGHELTIDDSSDPPLVATSTSMPRRFRIRGLAGVRAHVRGSIESSDLLAGRLAFQALADGEWLVRGPQREARYGADSPPPGRPVQGAGSVTHVAWSCPPGQERAWRQRVIGMGATVSRISGDRSPCFFFREPDGVLFSVAARDAETPTAARSFELPSALELPSRIARPTGLLTATR